MGLFPGFTDERLAVNGVEIQAVVGGSGPPLLLLLHGAPQSHVMWHHLAPRLAERFTVVATDLRGYGDSSKPPGGGDHGDYSFRTMAADQVGVMNQLGHNVFSVVAHDRGARVTHRMLLDHPEAVTRAALLDIVPTKYVYDHADRALATAYFHWFFFIQPAPLPELMIESNAALLLKAFLGAFGGTDCYDPAAMAEYERCFTNPDAIHAMCEDYRAAASIDLVHDTADEGRRIECPLLILWGTRGVVGRLYRPIEVWRQYASDVRGQGIDAGHFLAEERPDDTFAALDAFLR
ncbi:alpha/beta fold hydrolase [Mycolicibacterium sp. CBMA 226]|uniref:alpha/beta fold hydrolase n=1 Tax=Mycolicibacterium sp. CBMA 226 TaxID=2606611 RepID=UPI0012DC246B|nr:alpha/beta hydrolase [Mycolicibacterium sp. CBMA 226]MUL77517.1 alpha/beta hydrolase [Mycolicibacterium sp. CBMA 226]